MNAITRTKASPAGRAPRAQLLTFALVVLLATIGVAASRAAVAPKPATAAATPSAASHRVVAYYFYTSFRCASCRAIEAWSRAAIEEGFADEIRDGRLVWRAVNTDEKANKHFVKDFKLYTKSLVLVDEVRGRPAEWRNLEQVWQLLQDRPKFVRYVQGETRSFLSDHS